jgi:hypothetical protein
MMQAIATGHIAGLENGRKAIAASQTQEAFSPHPSSEWDKTLAKFRRLLKDGKV